MTNEEKSLLIAYLVDAGELDPDGDVEAQFIGWYQVREETVSGEAPYKAILEAALDNGGMAASPVGRLPQGLSGPDLPDAEYPGAALRAHSQDGRPAILHDDGLRSLDFPLAPAPEAVDAHHSGPPLRVAPGDRGPCLSPSPGWPRPHAGVPARPSGSWARRVRAAHPTPSEL